MSRHGGVIALLDNLPVHHRRNILLRLTPLISEHTFVVLCGSENEDRYDLLLVLTMFHIILGTSNRISGGSHIFDYMQVQLCVLPDTQDIPRFTAN
jgi:hypothetical protein